jgi:hypothetical protein
MCKLSFDEDNEVVTPRHITLDGMTGQEKNG